MSAGTLTLTNNSAAVSGSGTAFTTEVAAGDFIVVTVGGVPYTLPVKSVESSAALTLVSNFTGPTQAGAALVSCSPYGVEYGHRRRWWHKVQKPCED